MFDAIKNVSAFNSRGQSDLFASCGSAQEITDAFQQELARTIADSQNVKPYIVGGDACQGVFGKIDASGDGSLSKDEAMQALMPVVEDADIAERIYGILDPTGSGQVSQERFNECLDTVIKITSFEAHLNITEITQVSGSFASEGDFEEVVASLRNQDGISGQAVGTGGLSVDAFWMKLMEELDKNNGRKPSASGDATSTSPQASAAAGGAQASFQSATYAEASISVETVSANLGAVFSTMA